MMLYYTVGEEKHFLSEQEAQEYKRNAEKMAAAERHTPLGADYALRVLLEKHIQEIAPDDDTAARMTALYPEWADSIGQQVRQGFLVQHGGKLYRVRQPRLTFVVGQEPGAPGMEALFGRVRMHYEGTKYDPVPWEGNQTLEAGLYYTENGVLYICHTGSGQEVYQHLAELAVFVRPAEGEV